MAGPWENYSAPAAAEDGPWAKYGTGAQSPGAAPMSWGDVPGQALQNTRGSAVEFAKGVAQPFLHPIDTAQNVGMLAGGLLQQVTGDPGHNDYRPHAQAVEDFYKGRYGSEEGFKKAIAEDPVGVLGDFSMLLSGGGGLAARVPGIVGHAGEIASLAGRITNPVGAAAQLAKGVGAVAKGVTYPTRRAFEAARDPDLTAAREVQAALRKDVGHGLTEEEMQAAEERGQPIRTMDLGGGRATTRLARTAANFSPEAQETLDRTIGMRAGTRRDRTADFLSEMQNYPDAHEAKKAIDASAKATNRVTYDRAMEKGAGGVWNDRLAELINHPWVSRAIPSAIEESNAEAVLEGQPPMRNPFDTDAQGNLRLRVDEQGNAIRPTLEFWDALKKSIDGRISGAESTPTSRGDPNTVRLGKNIKDALLRETDSIVPEYRAARAGAEKFFGARDALQAGRDLATPGTRAAKMDNRLLAEKLRKYSPEERRLLQDGLIDQLMVTLRGPKGRTILDDLNASQNARNRLNMVLGPDKLAGITSFIHVEDVMDRFRTAVRSNSTTMQQKGDMDRLSVSLKTALISFMEEAAKKVGVGLDERVARSVADMLTSEDGERYAKAMRRIEKNGKLQKVFSVLPSATQLNAAGRLATGAQRGVFPLEGQ